MDNLLTLNHQTAVSVPSTMSTNSAESDLLSQINSENLIPDNVGPAISGQLAEVAKRYWVEESWKVPVVAKIAERLKMRSNCNFAKVPKLNEKIANNKKILPYHKWADKRLAEIQKSVSLATSAILQMSNAAIQYQQQPFESKAFVSLGIDAMTVLGKASQLISAERIDKLKPALNEDTRSLCDKYHKTSYYLFGENISKSLKLAEEKYK